MIEIDELSSVLESVPERHAMSLRPMRDRKGAVRYTDEKSARLKKAEEGTCAEDKRLLVLGRGVSLGAELIQQTRLPNRIRYAFLLASGRFSELIGVTNPCCC